MIAPTPRFAQHLSAEQVVPAAQTSCPRPRRSSSPCLHHRPNPSEEPRISCHHLVQTRRHQSPQSFAIISRVRNLLPRLMVFHDRSVTDEQYFPCAHLFPDLLHLLCRPVRAILYQVCRTTTPKTRPRRGNCPTSPCFQRHRASSSHFVVRIFIFPPFPYVIQCAMGFVSHWSVLSNYQSCSAASSATAWFPP